MSLFFYKYRVNTRTRLWLNIKYNSLFIIYFSYCAKQNLSAQNRNHVPGGRVGDSLTTHENGLF